MRDVKKALPVFSAAMLLSLGLNGCSAPTEPTGSADAQYSTSFPFGTYIAEKSGTAFRSGDLYRVTFSNYAEFTENGKKLYDYEAIFVGSLCELQSAARTCDASWIDSNLKSLVRTRGTYTYDASAHSMTLTKNPYAPSPPPSFQLSYSLDGNTGGLTLTGNEVRNTSTTFLRSPPIAKKALIASIKQECEDADFQFPEIADSGLPFEARRQAAWDELTNPTVSRQSFSANGQKIFVVLADDDNGNGEETFFDANGNRIASVHYSDQYDDVWTE